jgi:amino acid transporter
MNATPRVIYGWARGGTFFKVFTGIDAKSGIPRAALWLTLGLSIFWTLPFPSWGAMIRVVSAALVLSYATAPLTVAALRRTAPDMPRPFVAPALGVLGPLSFVIAALIVYWSDWATLSWLMALQIVLVIVYVGYKWVSPSRRAELGQELYSASWLIGFYILIFIISYLGTFGGRGIIGHPWDSLVVVAIALVTYYWGANTGLPSSKLNLGTGDDD